jgi:hypothetical protein
VVVVPEGQPVSIVLGRGRLRCPHCEQDGKIMADFKALDLNQKYKADLNPVYKHLGCGHVFSPGDPLIMKAYLEGDLVPKAALTALQDTVAELRAIVDTINSDRREVQHADAA